MPTITARDGTPIHVNDWGTGRTIVLVHGWPLSSEMWEYNAIPLAEQGFRVVSYDRRGFGRSGKPYTGYDYDTMTDDLAAVFDELDLSDAVLVGFSMGGGEVARYMTRHQGRGVGKAVLVSSVVPYLLKGPDNPDGVDQSVFDEFVEGLRADRPNFLHDFGKAFYGAGLLNFSLSAPFLDWTQGLALQASPKATLDCVRAFSATDFRPDTKNFRVPTLVIHGSGDKTVPLEVSGQRAHEMIAGSELVVYEGAAHGLHYTERDRLNADLARFARG
ncbi:alpha/beta hydrolase [Aurantimonas sp. Leaf443]|uniref:alpha/beta fold hydrolase n=1 Tax=Aurantimonas sp. Leaf443 TaxID=1736378 RepID=UPI0006F60C09|nr:alpha/beta hydrolase [Aurantimonas sp. Leaf443]KQT84012.1 arylesterase [Aurantimonas sp. Leaf443]